MVQPSLRELIYLFMVLTIHLMYSAAFLSLSDCLLLFFLLLLTGLPVYRNGQPYSTAVCSYKARACR